MGGAALKCFEALLLWIDGADDMSSALGHFNVTLSEIQSIFSEHDVNANSKLDFEEFVAFLSKRTSSLQVSCDAGAAGPAARQRRLSGAVKPRRAICLLQEVVRRRMPTLESRGESADQESGVALLQGSGSAQMDRDGSAGDVAGRLDSFR